MATKAKIVRKKSAPAVASPDPALMKALADRPDLLQVYMQTFVGVVTPPTAAAEKKTLTPPPAPEYEGKKLAYLDRWLIEGELFIRMTITPKGGLKQEFNPSSYNRGGFFGYEQWVDVVDAYMASPLRAQDRAWMKANGLKKKV